MAEDDEWTQKTSHVFAQGLQKKRKCIFYLSKCLTRVKRHIYTGGLGLVQQDFSVFIVKNGLESRAAYAIYNNDINRNIWMLFDRGKRK